MGIDVAALGRITIGKLRRRYAESLNKETKASNKARLIMCIAWRLQSQKEGDIFERIRQRAAELANDADVRLVDTNSQLTTTILASRKQFA